MLMCEKTTTVEFHTGIVECSLWHEHARGRMRRETRAVHPSNWSLIDPHFPSRVWCSEKCFCYL